MVFVETSEVCDASRGAYNLYASTRGVEIAKVSAKTASHLGAPSMEW